MTVRGSSVTMAYEDSQSASLDGDVKQHETGPFRMSSARAMVAMLAASSAGEPPRMSIDEWAAMPDDEPGELVGGQLVEADVADYEHEPVLSFINAVFRGWAAPRGGFVAGSVAKFAVGAVQGRKPDLSVYLPGGRILPRRGPIHVPPAIAIEIVSPTPIDARRDRLEKVHDYAAFGVHWYWIVDPATRALEVLELGDDGRYAVVVAAMAAAAAPHGASSSGEGTGQSRVRRKAIISSTLSVSTPSSSGSSRAFPPSSSSPRPPPRPRFWYTWAMNCRRLSRSPRWPKRCR